MKTWSISKRESCKRSCSLQAVALVYKRGLFKNSLKLARKHPYRSLCLMRLLASRLQLNWKRDPVTDVLLWSGATAIESANEAVCLNIITKTFHSIYCMFRSYSIIYIIAKNQKIKSTCKILQLWEILLNYFFNPKTAGGSIWPPCGFSKNVYPKESSSSC